jgi:hypothetical protein
MLTDIRHGESFARVKADGDLALREQFNRSLLVMLLPLLLLYPLPFGIVKLAGFEHWGGSQFGPALEYNFTTAGQNADVVIFGDSSAVVGLDPVEMSRDLGLKVINLPSTAASLPVVGDMSLKYYLDHNKPPKLLVFYFAPWNLDYAHAEQNFSIYEGEEILFRHGSGAAIESFASQHVTDLLAYPFQFYDASLGSSLIGLIRHQDHVKDVVASRGHYMQKSRTGAIAESCLYPQRFIDLSASNSVQQLTTRFAGFAAREVVYLAPIPACSNAQIFVQRDYSPLKVVGPPVLLPPSNFRADGPFVHALPVGVPLVSSTLVGVIKRSLGQSN